jgi:hypothetical protein
MAIADAINAPAKVMVTRPDFSPVIVFSPWVPQRPQVLAPVFT